MKMATIHETEEMEKQVFEVARQWEESLLAASRKWVKAVGESMPVEMPVLSALVKGSFDFAEELLKAQREFALGMLRATRPIRPAHLAVRTTPAHSPAPTAEPTRKAA